MLKEIMIEDSYKELLNERSGMMYVMDNVHNFGDLKGIELIKIIYEQKQDLKETIDFIVVCMDDMEVVKQCNEWIKDKQDDGLKNGVYFVKESKKYKQILRYALYKTNGTQRERIRSMKTYNMDFMDLCLKT